MHFETDQVIGFNRQQGAAVTGILSSLFLSIAFFVAAYSGLSHNKFDQVLGYSAACFLGLLCLYSIFDAFVNRNHTLTLGPLGFRETSISQQIVPWSVVTEVSDFQMPFRGTTRAIAVIVKIEDSAWTSLKLPRRSKLNRKFDHLFESDGIWLNHQQFDVDFYYFFELIKAYAKAHGGRVG